MTIWDEIDNIFDQAVENSEGTCTFSVPGEFSGYRGHFPGNPILPGIVQLSFIRRLAERRLGIPLRLSEKDMRHPPFRDIEPWEER